MPQDSLDLRVRYGEPFVEQFTIRPNVTMAVEYGIDGKPCVLYVKPHHVSMSNETVWDLLNEVAPSASRGGLTGMSVKGDRKPPMGVGVTMGANTVIMESYADSDVVLRYLGNDFDNAQIEFKRPDCSQDSKSSSPSQPGSEFHARYGKPDMERFIIRPDLMLTVEYGSDGSICQLILEAPRPLLQLPNPDKLISTDAVAEIFDQIVPPNSRGTEIGPSVTVVSSWLSIQRTIWKNVSLIHELSDCASLKPICEMRATITFERTACKKLPEQSRN